MVSCDKSCAKAALCSKGQHKKPVRTHGLLSGLPSMHLKIGPVLHKYQELTGIGPTVLCRGLQEEPVCVGASARGGLGCQRFIHR